MAFLDNLVAYWKFDESSGNAVDSSGNSNTLVNGNSTPFAAGKVNNGANFVRANSNYFSIADDVQSGLGFTGDFSFSLWVKLASAPDNSYYYLLAKSDEEADQRCYALYYQDILGVKSLEISVGSGTGWGTDKSFPFEIPVGIWTHITVTWDQSEHKAIFYKNGVIVGSLVGTLPASVFDGNAPFVIGAYHRATPTPNILSPCDGIIDEVYAFNSVKSSDDIRDYFNSITRLKTSGLPMFFNT